MKKFALIILVIGITIFVLTQDQPEKALIFENQTIVDIPIDTSVERDNPEIEKSSEELTQELPSETWYRTLDWETFDSRAQEPNSVVVDVRTEEEIAEGKIYKNALEINFYDEDFAQRVAQLDPEKDYLVYCRSGGRSGQALQIFKQQGLKAHDLAGGISIFQ